MKSLSVSKAVTAVMLAGLVLLPLYSHLSGNIFILTLFTRIVILALAAASLNLIMGYGGMMSFGHAAYLGIGGYAVGILAFEGVGSGFIQWPVALLASALFALVIGGIGSIRGAFIAAIMIGLIDTMGRSFLPNLLRQVLNSASASTAAPALSSMLIYLLMAIVLVARPEGLFPANRR